MTTQTRKILRVGDSGAFRKTVTEADVQSFAEASGDFNPVHFDEEYAKTTKFGHRIAHGLLTAGIISTTLGHEIPGMGTIFVELHIQFRKPVFLNDTITATATVTEIIAAKRVRLMVACVNQNGEDVALGNAIVIPPPGMELLA